MTTYIAPIISLANLFLAPAFTLLGTAVTWLEVTAFILALANVTCDAREIHWAWPLALLSSLLYAWLFTASKLYGEASVNIFFAFAAMWGWWQWLRGTRAGSAIHSRDSDFISSTAAANIDQTAWKASPVLGLQVARLDKSGAWFMVVTWLLLWVLCAVILGSITDSDVPVADGFVTAGSIVGTYLLGRKFIENWPLWLIVNAASTALFMYKDLSLTAILYVIFMALSVWGWRAWAAQLNKQFVEKPTDAASANKS